MSEQTHYLIDVLTGRDINGRIDPLFNLELKTEDSKINYINQDFSVANIKVIFNKDGIAERTSALTLTLQKNNENRYKIYTVKSADFFSDYYAYKKIVLSVYHYFDVKLSPVTLAAFKTAEQMKTRYDSVIWFAYNENKTYFYVVKGKWDLDKDLNFEKRRFKDSVIEPYKMGLVNPEMKEIIPPQYSLIHNISGTFPGLIEVEDGIKKGFYNLEGAIVIPVKFSQIYPIEDDQNLAVLKDSNSYYYLKKDMTISDKVDITLGDFFSKIKNVSKKSDLYANALLVVTEYNSRYNNGAVYLPPSHLVEFNLAEREMDFKNPLRKGQYDEVNEKYLVDKKEQIKSSEGWFVAAFFAIRDYFLGGRSEFYDRKNLVVIDKKKNRIYSQEIAVDESREDEGDGGSTFLPGICDINNFKAINDSLFEVKTGSVLSVELYDSTKTISGGPYYHYYSIKNDKLIELPNKRNFGFTKYIKMDDSYLDGCYNMLIGTGQYDKRQQKTIDHITPEILRYMKNEIYADYKYEFKDKRWPAIFFDQNHQVFDTDGNPIPQKYNVSVDDSLTEIDKYNINWIVQKLKGAKVPSNTLAAK